VEPRDPPDPGAISARSRRDLGAISVLDLPVSSLLAMVPRSIGEETTVA